MKRLTPLLALFMALNCPAANSELNYIYYAAGTDANGGTSSMALFGWLPPEHQVSWTGSGGDKAVVTTLDAENQYSPDFVKTGIYKYDRRAEDPGGKGWLLAAFCEPGYAGDTFEVRIWASATAYKSSVAGNCYMLYDPISHAWGRWKLNTDEIWATSSGSQEDPWFKCTLPTVRTSNPLTSDVYVLVFRDYPEAGSIVIMITGLVGFGGWTWQRRACAHRRL